MAAPTKPWERADQNNRSCCQPGGDTGIPSFQATDRGTVGPGNIARNPAPSVPFRDGISQTGSLYGGGTPYNQFGGSYGGLSSYSSYGSYGYSSPYTTGYGSSMYSPYGGGYGGYGSGIYGNRFGGGYGGSHEGYSRFLQQAEENSRPAFQSIESIVQAFASVSMMLESTFATVHNCFRAVLGVADHFSRLKVNMARILSALAIFRFLRYIYHRLLEILRLRQSGYAEELWKEAAESALAVPGNIQSPGGSHPSPSWPIFMFFAVVVGGPYVIWRLLCSEDETQGIPEWASGEEDHVVARAEYDFASDRQDEVSFKAGDLLNLAPKELQPNIRGWLLASVDGTKVGLIPGNYIKVQGRRKGRKYTTPPGAERQIVPSPSTTGFQLPVMESMGSQASEADLASSWNGWAGDKQGDKSQECGCKEGEKTT